MTHYYKMWQDLSVYIKNKTGYDVIIYPASIQPQYFHLAMSLLPDPKLDGSGQITFRVNLCARAKTPSSAAAISETTECFIQLAQLLSEPRGGVLGKSVPAMLSIDQQQDDQNNNKNMRSDEFSNLGSWNLYLKASLNDIRSKYGTIHDEKSQ
ncbi:MAG: hypothetical protein ACRCVN_05125 [Spirochaetia bacterium]